VRFWELPWWLDVQDKGVTWPAVRSLRVRGGAVQKHWQDGTKALSDQLVTGWANNGRLNAALRGASELQRILGEQSGETHFPNWSGQQRCKL